MAPNPPRRLSAVLFTDIVGSTEIAAELGDAGWRSLLTRHHALARRLLRQHRSGLHDTAGDGIFATFAVPADALAYATRATAAVRDLGVEIRVGVHFGETQEIDHKMGGIAVHTAARVMSAAGAGEIVTTATVPDLVAGAGYGFEDLGRRSLKGIEGLVNLFRLVRTESGNLPSALPAEELAARRAVFRTEREVAVATDSARRRGMVIGGVVVAATLVAALIALPLLRRDREGAASSSPGGAREPGLTGPALVAIDPDSGEVVRRIDHEVPFVGCDVYDGDLVAGAGALWQLEGVGLRKLDPGDGSTLGRYDHGATVAHSCEVAVVDSEPEQVWFLNGSLLVALDPATVEPFSSRSVYRFEGYAGGITVSSLAVTDEHMLVATGRTMFAVPRRPGEVERWPLRLSVDALESEGKGVYAIDVVAGRLARLDPVSGKVVVSTNISAQDLRLRIGEGAVWLLDLQAGFVTPYDLGDLRPGSSVRVGEAPNEMDVGLGAAWVGDAEGLYRLDILSGDVTTLFPGQAVGSVAVDTAEGVVWVQLHGPEGVPSGGFGPG